MKSIFYVYVYLDPRKPGHYVYDEYEFDYEPFYVGKGCNGRAYIHLKENVQIKNNNKLFVNKIKKIQKETDKDPVVILYRKNIIEKTALNIEVNMVKTIGRKDLKKGPLCNLTDAGEGVSGCIRSEEWRKKVSERNSILYQGKGNPMFGKHHTEETKNKIGNANKGNSVMFGKHHTEETKNKISKSLIGKTRTILLGKDISNRINENQSKLMIERHRTIGSPLSKKWLLDFGDNNTMIVINLKKFCREHDLQYHTIKRNIHETISCVQI